MALLERVATLLRANLNDLLDKAADPEKMLKQLLLDMENQLLQLKTQVAIAVADQHLLEGKEAEHSKAITEWRRRAELAVGKNDDVLARAALDRSLSHAQLAAGFAAQITDQRAEAEGLRENYARLRQKLTETAAEGDLLLAEWRRARAHSKSRTQIPNRDGADRALRQLKATTARAQAQNAAVRELEEDAPEHLDARFSRIERNDEIDALLLELKSHAKLLTN